jgi:SagB-type dehydrogenase family enzyme
MRRVRRSPFLIFYWNSNNQLIVSNYNKQTSAITSNEILRILELLKDWKSEQEIYHSFDTIERSSLKKGLRELIRMNIIDTDKTYENHNPNYNLWQPIDLAMQRQTSFGGYFPELIKVKNPPIIKSVSGIKSVKLFQDSEHKDKFYEVMVNRKSIRKYGSRHMNIHTLSIFLHRCAAIKKVTRTADNNILTKRNYPSGGAKYPLEIYVSSNFINGIEKGLFYYDPFTHQLKLLDKKGTYQNTFNRQIFGVQSPAINRNADAVLIITAVFARTMAKYSKIGLPLIMQELGALYQTMYLVATEMDLAPCALGLTNEQLIQKWLNLDWFNESHVGTFLLGEK